MNSIIKVLLVIGALGLAWALLIMFGYNPFAAIKWGLSWLWQGVVGVKDTLLSSNGFRKAVTVDPSSMGTILNSPLFLL